MMNGDDVNTTVPALLDDQLVHVAEQAEKRVEAVKKIKVLALRVTNANDWVDQGGKPYLMSSGAEKIGRLFGISWRLEEPKIEFDEDGHYTVLYKGEFGFSGITIEAIGTRSSRDEFLRVRWVKGADGKNEKILLPASEVDKGDLKKAAFTNCLGNGITRLLGIRNLTYEDLATVGISKDQVTRFEYKKKGQAQEQGQGGNGDDKDQRAEIRRMCLEMNSNDSKVAADDLERITAWKNKEGKEFPGKRNVADFSDKQVPVIYGQVKKIYEEWQQNTKQPEQPSV